MLYDNAQLVRLYLDGWRLSREPRFKQVVEETLAYIRREMVHPDGGFYTAQDADSEGHEGKYFVWEQTEIKAVLGSDLGEIFCRVYDITDHGNFEDKNIPNLIHANGRIEVKEVPDVEKVIAEARRKLLEVRERRVKPLRDEKILTSWNGLMISGVLDAYQTLGSPAYLEMADKALAFLLDRAYKNGRLFRTVTGGIGKLNGYLDDYAFLTAALIDAFEATAKPTSLDKARELTAVMVEQFWDPQTGGCFFTGKDHESLLQRMKTGEDSAIPSGNAVATMNFLRLFFYTGHAEGILVHVGAEQPQGLLGLVHVVLLASVEEQAQKVHRRHGVAGGYGGVFAGLHALKDLFVVHSREKAAAGLRVPELLHHDGGQLTRLIQVGRLGSGLEGVDQGRRQEGVVVQIRVELADAARDGPEQTPMLVCTLQQETQGFLGHLEICRIAERLIGIQDTGDHQAVPAREDLLVAQGLDPPLPAFKELASGVRHHLVQVQHVLGFDPAVGV